MGFKSTIGLTREEAIDIIISHLDGIRLTDTLGADIDRKLELILEEITDYNNPESKYYFNNFSVTETKQTDV